MNYRKVNDKDRIIEIFNIIETQVYKGKNIGMKRWGNPAGAYENETYELSNGADVIWVNLMAWLNASTYEENRKALGVCRPKQDGLSLSPQLDVILPYKYSKRFDTRIYENSNNVQIRKYGKFTVGRKGIKREEFFDYLRNSEYSNEVEIDEEGNKYVSILNIDDKFNYEYMVESLIKWRNIIENFKSQYR